ncbi:MAG: winged helix-turn-helix domain-containing protein [Candidatus Woesearchaeota archaeon]
MTDEPFLLVSLEEEKAKALAQVLSNDTSRKILNYLAKVEHATETQISKELNMPLSTVHYNLSLLVKSSLVSDEHYSYSEKGKEIIHYSLSNKYVIIAPKNISSFKENLKENLKKFLPVVIISGAITFFLKYSDIFFISKSSKSEPMLMAQEVSLRSMPFSNTNQDFAFWFLLGSLLTLVIYFIWVEIILKKFKK